MTEAQAKIYYAKSPDGDAGDVLCPICNKPYKKYIRGANKKIKAGQPYYFAWFYRCKPCGRFFMLEAGKRWVKNNTTPYKQPTVEEAIADIKDFIKVKISSFSLIDQNKILQRLVDGV